MAGHGAVAELLCGFGAELGVGDSILASTLCMKVDCIEPGSIKSMLRHCFIGDTKLDTELVALAQFWLQS